MVFDKMIDEEDRLRFEARRRERREDLKRAMKQGFWDAAKREGFAVKSWDAWRRREGAWQTMRLHKGGHYQIDLYVRFDRSDDPERRRPGPFSEYDSGTGLERLVERRRGVEARRELTRAFSGWLPPGDLILNPILEAAWRKHIVPWMVGADEIPFAERVETMVRFLREVAMPWFGERASPGALQRIHRNAEGL